MSATLENADFFYESLRWICMECKLMQRMGKINKLRDFSVMSVAQILWKTLRGHVIKSC